MHQTDLRFHGPTYLQNLANISCDILRFKVNSESKKEGVRVGVSVAEPENARSSLHGTASGKSDKNI